MRQTDTVLEEEVFFCLNLFSGATDGQSFGRRSFFCLNLLSGEMDRQAFGRRSFFLFEFI